MILLAASSPARNRHRHGGAAAFSNQTGTQRMKRTNRRTTHLPETLGQRLKAARKTAGLTQAEAAEAIGKKQNTISSYETAAKEPSIEVIRKLADVYRTTCGKLLD
jgi:ribosome-binding protein aMBF1 (putative translation factor)